MSGEHPCAVDDCTAPARAGQLMCLAHWKGLPRKLQTDVNATWRNYRRDAQAYLVARGHAIAFWRGKPAQQGSLL